MGGNPASAASDLLTDSSVPLPGEPFAGFWTWHPPLVDLIQSLPQLAATDLPVLILGEPGTGKELVAHALWALSSRRPQPFIRLNCATLSPELAASELFGHERGAFTGAMRRRPGSFRLAHRGTLFLDEVGDLPLAVQPQLLRALEQGEIVPVGGSEPLRVDVRVLAATNQPLPQLMAQGRFRQDVFDRLAVLMVCLPPLRERGEDVIHLARRFLAEEGRRYGRNGLRLSSAAERRLRQHPWPGNVRELKNVILRAVVFSRGSLIREQDLLFAPAAAGQPRPNPSAAAIRPVREELEEMLRESGGNVSAVARRLGVCSRTVYRWLKSLDLDVQHLRTVSLAPWHTWQKPSPAHLPAPVSRF
jgi:DNA-binding NtrC family response regulator